MTILFIITPAIFMPYENPYCILNTISMPPCGHKRGTSEPGPRRCPYVCKSGTAPIGRGGLKRIAKVRKNAGCAHPDISYLQRCSGIPVRRRGGIAPQRFAPACPRGQFLCRHDAEPGHGVYLAIAKKQPGNIFGGALTFYLVATAWMTARRRVGRPGIFDWGGLLLVLGIGVVTATFGIEAANSRMQVKYGYSAGPYFFLGCVAVLAAAGDVRMLVRGGISGTSRIARHLWRMCFALFIAAASIFLARQQLFPALFRRTGILYFLRCR